MIQYNNVNKFSEAYWGDNKLSLVFYGNEKIWPEETPQPTGVTTAISYTATTKLNVALSSFTPTATAETFSNGVGQIEFAENVTAIGFSAFSSKTAMTSVVIPDSVTSIGGLAFTNCSGLTSITINATTPPTLGRFPPFGNTNDCPIYVPCASVNAYKTAWSVYESRIQCVEPFGGKFKATYSGGQTYSADCDGSPILTSSETIPSGYQITAMTTAEIGSCVTTIGDYALSSHSSLKYVRISDSVTSIGNSAFYGCSGLTSIYMPSGVTSIGNYAFFRCTSITSITIPNSVQTIGGSVFYECSRLTSITIGNGVQTIGNSLFLSCISLQSVTIPSGVTSIGGWAFYYCSSLTSITCNATTPAELGTSAFDNTNNCPIYVPSGSVETYKTASGWSTYADRIQAIP